MHLLQVGCSSFRTNIINMPTGKEGILMPGGSQSQRKYFTQGPQEASVIVTNVYSRINHCGIGKLF